MKNIKYKISIGWLYPELMSTYGDRGNVICLTKRCEWRGIEVQIVPIDFETTSKQLDSCDLIFGGGAQDRQQGIAIDDLRLKKGPILKKMFAHNVPGLFVCGAPQLLGKYYVTADGQKLPGLDIFDMYTTNPGPNSPRCIGNLVAELNTEYRILNTKYQDTIVGFENHGGRTYLGSGVKPLATIISGYGNNGEDGTEGAVYKNCLATYSHGPFLPKNPHIADWLIKSALEVKYGQAVQLEPLDDTLEWQAHDFILKKYG